MHRSIAATSVLLTLGLVVPGFGASQGDRDDCQQVTDNDRRIINCTRVIDDRSESPRNRAIALNFRGNALRDKGDNDRAIADFTEAIRLDPKFAFPHHNRGVAHRNKGDIERAMADYTAAINLDRKYAFAYSSRGVALLDLREFDRAMADCNQAISLNPKMASGYNCRGLAWRTKGDLDRALADCNEAIKLAPKYSSAYNCRGLVFGSLGDHDRAIADFTEAITISPRFVFAFANRGRVYANKSDHDRAIADYSEAIRLSPHFRAAYRNRGNAWSAKGDDARATADYTEAARLNPKPTEVASAIGRAGGPTETAAAPAPPPKSADAVRSPGIGRRVALVIGNSAYAAVPALFNPERDASAIAETLRSIGFASVITRNNVSRKELVEALKRFQDEVERSDWAVIYYAGHGVEVGGINYLVPVDGRLKDDRDVQDEAVPLERVLASVENASKLRLVILDACRDNPFLVSMRRASASRSIGRGLTSVEPEGGVLVAYAAKHGQIAFDGEGTGSPFATALVKRLSTPNLEISMLFRMVRDDVLNATGRKQEPYVYGSLPGESLYFVQK